jgi:hypothetical protein
MAFKTPSDKCTNIPVQEDHSNLCRQMFIARGIRLGKVSLRLPLLLPTTTVVDTCGIHLSYSPRIHNKSTWSIRRISVLQQQVTVRNWLTSRTDT